VKKKVLESLEQKVIAAIRLPVNFLTVKDIAAQMPVQSK
jgi:hypothetical protein